MTTENQNKDPWSGMTAKQADAFRKFVSDNDIPVSTEYGSDFLDAKLAFCAGWAECEIPAETRRPVTEGGRLEKAVSRPSMDMPAGHYWLRENPKSPPYPVFVTTEIPHRRKVQRCVVSRDWRVPLVEFIMDWDANKKIAGPIVVPPELMDHRAEIDRINRMSHAEMCRLWRFHPAGHPYFDGRLPYHEVFRKRLFDFFGGFTPEISKEIGWEDPK